MARSAQRSERGSLAALSGAALTSALSGAALTSALSSVSASVDGAPANPPCGQVAGLPDPYHELETKYLFGFTEGADTGAEGEQSVEFETTTAFGRRGGRYGAVEREIAYEGVPSQLFGFELSAHGFADNIRNVEGIANASGVNFMGLSTETRYLVIGSGPGLPPPDRAQSSGTPMASATDSNSPPFPNNAAI